MKFIPDLSDGNIIRIENDGERFIYEQLADIRGHEDWICYHSLYLPEHDRKQSCELDFLISTPEMLIGLEVKTGFSEIRDGVWYYATYSKAESPFQQVSTALDAFIKRFLKYCERNNKNIEYIHTGYGVLFPDIVFNINISEGASEVVYDARDTHRSIKEYLIRVMDYTENKVRITGKPPIQKLNSDTLSVLRNYIRTNRTVTLSEFYLLNSGQKKITELTQIQINAFTGLMDNERVLINGSAGTGKTILAERAAELSALEGRKTALFCYNRLLAERLRTNLSQKSVGSLEVWGIDFWISKKIDEIFGEEINRELRSQSSTFSDYIKIAVSKLIECGEVIGLFDEIIIDEGQDLLSETYIYLLLETVLKGGIDSGRWRIFYDAQLQSELFKNLNQDVLSSLKNTNHVNYCLEQNCRNSKKIIENITRLTEFKQDPYIGSINGTMVYADSYKSDAEQWSKIIEILNRVDKENVNREKVDIVSICGLEDSIGYKMRKKLSDRHIQFLTPENLSNHHGYSGLSSIFKYKGLENDIIILTDITSLASKIDKAQLYTGMSRAKHQLYMLLDESVIQEYDKKINNEGNTYETR